VTKVIVDHQGSVYVSLRPVPAGREVHVSHYLEKHGILLHWSEPAVLAGIEFKPDGNEVEVQQFMVNTAP
jgi:hypothetical protein